MKKILFIIPAYNEQDCICKTVNSVFKAGYDYIVINDGSIDNTDEICKLNNIKHINLINNLGIGGAVQTGYKYAYDNGYDIAIQFDGDGQHDIKSVNNLIKPILNNECNMVIGSRFVSNKKNFRTTFSRRVGIKIISNVIKMKTGNRIYDTTSGFRAVDRNVIELFSKLYPLEYPEPVSTVNVLKKGYKVKEVYANMFKRTSGKSSISSWKNVYYMINVVLSIIIKGDV